MENTIIFLNNIINLYEDKLVNLSIEIKKDEKSYKKLCSKNKKYNKNTLAKYVNDKELFSNVVNSIEKDSIMVINTLLKSKLEYDNYIKEIDVKLKSYGLTRDVILSDSFINSIKNQISVNPSKKQLYDKILSIRETEEKLFSLNEQITNYTLDIFIEKQEALLNEKEEYKNIIKRCKWIIDKIRKNEKFLPIDISRLNDFILDCEDESLKEILKKELRCYIDRFSVKKEEEKEDESNSSYIDNIEEVDNQYIEKDEDKNDELIDNYAYALLSFDDYNQVKTFLDSLIYKYDMNIFINKLSKKLTNNKILNYLNQYMLTLNIEESKEDDKDNIIVLYNGFMKEKNIILDDISKITSDYYNDINKGIKLIKEGTNKVPSIMKVPKVKKLRVNDIRIAYKRLTSNVYIILGIYCKKSNWGEDIIKSIMRRNNEIKVNENSIITGLDIENLRNNILEINEHFENEINSKIEKYIK